MSPIILQTKIYNPLRHLNLISRERLNKQIEEGIRLGHKLTIIAAPAGYGKSTVGSMWAYQTQRQVAWFSIDESDNEVIIFWTYVISAFRTMIPDFADRIFTELTALPPPPIETILPALINEISQIDKPLALILDDYHLINNQDIHEGVSFLIDHQPKRFHLVISTRADPPLPVARWRAQRWLTELRVEVLRFTNDEAGELLNEILKLGLTDEEISLLDTRTEGWGVGLLLAAQSLQGRSDKHSFIAAFSGNQNYILEYLIGEVLNRQPDEIRRFFLVTSILDQLCGPLCDAVTGEKNSETTLLRLDRENLFIIPLDQSRIWYRYHHLFADLLINFLHKEFTKEAISQMYRRAGLWYEESGNIEKAVNYAIKSQDFILAADLIESIVDQVIARGQVKTLLGWIDAIPEKVLKSRPRMLMHKGWVVFLSGKVKLASHILLKAKDSLKDTPESTEKKLLNGRLSAMLATITVLTRDITTAICEAHQAIVDLPGNDFIYLARATRVLGVAYMFQGEFNWALENLERAKTYALEGQNKFLASEILSQIGTLRKHQGKLSKALDAYQQILNFYDQPELAPPACLGYVGLGEIALEKNDLKTAELFLNKSIELSIKGNIGYALQPAYLIHGVLKCAQNNYSEAIETLQKGEGLSRAGGGSLESILGLAWYQIRMLLACGEIDKALKWATGISLPEGRTFDEMPVILDEMHQTLLARVYLQTGDWNKVLEIYDRIYHQANAGGRLARAIELSLFKSIALQKLGKSEEAYSVFDTCLTLAEPEGFIRLFLETGEVIKYLLRIAKTRGEHEEYVNKLLDAFNNQQNPSKNNVTGNQSLEILLDQLTEREAGILQLLCAGYSNKQIADKLIVSVNTVKKHTSNIYEKLGVQNRTQAVLRAIELNLV